MNNDNLQEAFRQLASISAWGCVWFNCTRPTDDIDMYRVEIHESDLGGDRLVNESGNDLAETITRALAVYEAQRIKPSMEIAMREAIIDYDAELTPDDLAHIETLIAQHGVDPEIY